MSVRHDFERLEIVARSLPDATRAQLVGAVKAVAPIIAGLDALFSPLQRETFADAASGIAQQLGLRAAMGRDWRKPALEALTQCPTLQSIVGELIAAFGTKG